MCRHNSYAPLCGSYTLPIVFVIAFGFLITPSFESISSPIWSDSVQDLSSKTHQTGTEWNPLNEGFIVLANKQKRSSPAISVSTTDVMFVKRTHPPDNTSLTTLNTVTESRQKRSLNDRLIDMALKPISPETVEGFESFLKADDDQLNRQLINMQVTIDGSSETTELSTEQTSETTSYQSTTTESTTVSTTTSTAFVFETPEILSNYSKFLVTINCTNANDTLNNILSQFQTNFNVSYNSTAEYDESQCSNTGELNLTLSFYTSNDITVINDIFEALYKVKIPEGVKIFTVDRCGDNRTVLVTNVTPCYFTNLCYLCGRNPERGVCPQSSSLSTCRCFSNVEDPSRPYQGDRCYPADPKPLALSNSLSSWTPIVIGVLAGLAGLFCAITCCLCLVFLWRNPRLPTKDQLRIRRLWHLPRAVPPAPVAAENPTTTAVDEANPNDSIDTSFFQDLDEKMGANLRATIARPNTSGLIASLPSTTPPITGLDDPIADLDGIIDSEDVDMTFHDPLNDLFDEELLEAINPNLQLPRPEINSKPTGLFSFLHRT